MDACIAIVIITLLAALIYGEVLDWRIKKGIKMAPLTKKGEKLKKELQKEYGKKKGESVLYAMEKKGTAKGITKKKPMVKKKTTKKK
jgi:hypothetical protein